MHIRCYADAPFASNDDISSQIVFIIVLCDSLDQSHIIEYRIHKSRKVVRSALAAEVSAFVDAFDAAFFVAADLKKPMGLT